ncbi:hypothetical protein SHO565_08680 [Streptomyces sp. HO565]
MKFPWARWPGEAGRAPHGMRGGGGVVRSADVRFALPHVRFVCTLSWFLSFVPDSIFRCARTSLHLETEIREA